VPWHEERLRRILRFRISDHPDESDVFWSKGKGAIGECWARGIPIPKDMRAIAAKFGNRIQATEADFLALTDAERCGFTFAEFIQTIGKYGEIYAMPIRAEHTGEPIGVLSIDCVTEAYADEHAPSILSGGDIEVFARRAARYIRDDVAKF
jgi:hypothetical protein